MTMLGGRWRRLPEALVLAAALFAWRALGYLPDLAIIEIAR